MKCVPLKILKQNFSEYAEIAASGTEVQVTKYNKPFIYLIGARPSSLHVGAQVGVAKLKSISKKINHGEHLKVLKEDRDEDR